MLALYTYHLQCLPRDPSGQQSSSINAMYKHNQPENYTVHGWISCFIFLITYLLSAYVGMYLSR